MARLRACPTSYVRKEHHAQGQLSSGQGPWELIGQVVLQQEGKQEPFDEEYKAIVRPRACGMGGEAVGITMNATAEGAFSSGTSIAYGVLRKRSSQAATPKKF